jgi:hypothetical protein
MCRTYKQLKNPRPSGMDNWRLANKPAGAVEILFATSTTAPQPSVLFSRQQESTAITHNKQKLNKLMITLYDRSQLQH